MENEKQVGLEMDVQLTGLELELASVIADFERRTGRAVERVWLQRRGETAEGKFVPSVMSRRNRFVLRSVEVALDDRELVGTEWAMGASDDRADREGTEIQD